MVKSRSDMGIFKLRRKKKHKKIKDGLNVDQNNNAKLKKSKKDGLDKVTTAELEEEVRQNKLNKQQLITQNKEKTFELQKLRKKLTVSRRILQSLYDGYTSSAGTCPCCRYSDLDMLVREALDEYGRQVEGIDTGEFDPDDEKLQLVSPLVRLVERSRRMSVFEHEKAEQLVRLTDMSVGELQTELLGTISQIERTTKEFMVEEGHFTRLKKNFEKLSERKRLFKYVAIKRMIEEATEDCLREF